MIETYTIFYSSLLLYNDLKIIFSIDKLEVKSNIIIEMMTPPMTPKKCRLNNFSLLTPKRLEVSLLKRHTKTIISSAFSK